MSAILSVQGLSVQFGALKAVQGVSFEAQSGGITAVIGPNGAGKSSLFNLISGAIRPTSGVVHFEGVDVTGLAPHELLGSGLSRSFQITNLFFDLTVRENLRLAAQFLERGRGLFRPLAQSSIAWQRVDELLSQFDLQSRADELAGYLSHGEQRRLEIAVSLASRPRMLLLDEPSLGIAPKLVQDIARSIVAINRDEGVSVLLVEQNSRMALSISHRAYAMATGNVVIEGNSKELLHDDRIKAAYLGGEV